MKERWWLVLELAGRLELAPAEVIAEARARLRRGKPEPTPMLLAWWLEIPLERIEALVALARALPPDPSPADVTRAVERGSAGTSLVDSTTANAGEVPRRLGPYELLEEIGRGGMGVVFRARHVRLGRDAAVKVLDLDRCQATDARERFAREAEALARLGKHPHIVAVHDCGEEGRFAWYAMELVEGRSLRRALARGLSTRDAVVVVEKVARALDLAHRHGLVHRDVKPENVLVGSDGEPRITDFGLARDVESAAWLTSTGQILGTPHYMAPEQVRGQVDAIDARTDVYALGAVLYEAVCARPAHGGGSVAEVLASVLAGDVVPPRAIRASIDRDLEAICLACLSPDREARYATAAALADDLARWRDDRPVSVRPPGVAGRVGYWARRRASRPAPAAIAALVVAAVAIALGRPDASDPTVPLEIAGPPVAPEPDRDPVPPPADLDRLEGRFAVRPRLLDDGRLEFAYSFAEAAHRADWEIAAVNPFHDKGPFCKWEVHGSTLRSGGHQWLYWKAPLAGDLELEFTVRPSVAGNYGAQICDDVAGRAYRIVPGYDPPALESWASAAATDVRPVSIVRLAYDEVDESAADRAERFRTRWHVVLGGAGGPALELDRESRVRIVRAGDAIRLFLDGVEIASARDGSYERGRICLFGQPYGYDAPTASWRDVTIRGRLDPEWIARR